MQCLARYRELQKREEGAGKWSKAEQQRLLVSSPPSQANPCLPCLCVHLLPLHCLKRAVPVWNTLACHCSASHPACSAHHNTLCPCRARPQAIPNQQASSPTPAPAANLPV